MSLIFSDLPVAVLREIAPLKRMMSAAADVYLSRCFCLNKNVMNLI